MKSLIRTCPQRWRIISAVLLAMCSFAGGVWFGSSQDWMEVDQLSARYQVGALEVTLTGYYEVNRECVREKDLLWRIELIATDGQIAQFAPPEPRPSLRKGSHFYEGAIPLTEPIMEDGWTARLLITCMGESPETVVSTTARVIRHAAADSRFPSPP